MKQKLLFINGHLDTGGVEKALLDLLTHLDYEKYQVDLLLTERLGDYADQLPPQVNILLRSIERTYGSFPRVMLQCLKKRDWFSFKMRLVLQLMQVFGQRWVHLAGNMLTDGKHYDCAIGFRPGFCTQIAVFGVNADRRISWWHHGEIDISKELYLETALGCDQIVAVSDACRQMLAAGFPMLADKLVTIPNMLDVQALREKATRFDPYPQKDLTHIVSAGRLAPEKHFENAVHAARYLKDRGCRFQWHLVGDGVCRESLRQLVKVMDVAECFLFEGNQVNPYPYVKHADLFVHPSYVESFGIVAAEALALGVPCVVTESAGIRDFLIHGHNALLTAQDPEALSEKVLAILQDRQMYARLKEQTICPERFLPEEIMKQIDHLLKPGRGEELA